MRRILFVASSLLCLVFLPLRLFAVEDAFVSGLVREALEKNPSLLSLRQIVEAEEAEIISESSLPQPRVGFGRYGESVQTKAGPMESRYSFTQELPLFSKLTLKKRIAEKEAAIARIKYLLARRGVAEDLRRSFYTYYFLTRSIHLLSAEKMILEALRQQDLVRYESLQLPQHDLVRIDAEITRIEEKILGLRVQERRMRGYVNILMGRDVRDPLAIPLGYRLVAPDTFPERESVVDHDLKETPHIFIERLREEKEEFSVSLAKQGFFPDLGIIAEYVEIGEGTTTLDFDGRDAWMVGAQVRIPLWFWKTRADIQSASHRRDAQQYAVKGQKDSLAYQFEDIFFQIKTAHQLIDLYDNVLLPQAEQEFSVARTGYESGAIEFGRFIEAERNLISLKVAALKQTVDYHILLAHLEYIRGKTEEEESL